MNTPKTISEIEKELVEKITDYGYNNEYGYYNDFYDDVMLIVKPFINEILDSIPLEEKEIHGLNLIKDTENKGYNQKTREIKEWKSKILNK
jgi:hypothetical protein